MHPLKQGHTKGNPLRILLINTWEKGTRSNQVAKPQPSKQLRHLPMPYPTLRQGNMRTNLRARERISILNNLVSTRRARDVIAITMGTGHDNARPHTVNAVGQAQINTSPYPKVRDIHTFEYHACATIYPSIAHLISKPMSRQPYYKPTKNTGMFCCYHEYDSHDSEKCVILKDHIEALALEGKIDQFLLHPQRDNRSQRQVNVIY